MFENKKLYKNWFSFFIVYFLIGSGSDDGQRVDTTFMVDSITGTKFNYGHQEITSGSEEQQNPSIFKSSDDRGCVFLMEQPYNYQTLQTFMIILSQP